MDQASGLRTIVQSNTVARSQKSPKNPGPRSIPRVVAVTSGKGGVGKSHCVGSLALALTKIGKRVVVVDADVGLANMDILFNLRPRYNISHVLSGEKKLEEVMVTTGQGVRIVPGGSGFANFTQLSDGEKLNLLSEFEVLGETTDFLLVDTGAGISSNVLYFNAAADEILVVATREPTSITDAYALMKVLSKEYGTRHFKLLVNMVESEKEAKSVYASLSGAIDKFLKNVVLEYFGSIPMDINLQKAVLKRSTVVEYAPQSPAAKSLGELAEKMARSPIRPGSDGNIKFFMRRIFELDRDR
ncbi:MAG: MinD/ParA family protein [Desulfobacterium sp.]|nr:MinD/ParA family protein [Desulfobacterium sp.]